MRFTFHPPVSRRPKSAGFTLVELMVVIAVLATLLALAAPSFTPLMERWRVRQASELLQSTLYFARSEAIKRGAAAVQTLPAGTCTDGGWNCGWLVCADDNRNGICDAGEDVLQRYDAPQNVTITRTDSVDDAIGIDRWGAFGGARGFTAVPKGKTISDYASLGICVNAGGAVRTQASAAC